MPHPKKKAPKKKSTKKAVWENKPRKLKDKDKKKLHKGAR